MGGSGGSSLTIWLDGQAGLTKSGAVTALNSFPIKRAGWGPLSVCMWVADRSEGESVRLRSGAQRARSSAFDLRERSESSATAASSKSERENASGFLGST